LRRSAVTGPGWTDELARIFDPREAGPEWQKDFGYRGRPRIRLLIDGEDLVHSYAQALYMHTGRWTGPLSDGLEKALMYGAWAGGAPEPNPMRDPKDPQMEPPEIMTFVAMPADLIEAVTPGNVTDGYPEEARKQIGRCLFGEDGYFVNEWIRQLQDENRLVTWMRSARLPGGAARPNALLVQKYYQPERPVGFRLLRSKPILLAQVMGAGLTLKVGEKVEALKSGRLIKGKWLPSIWKSARVLAVNYDGSYDLQFDMGFGPYRERRHELKDLKGRPGLSLRKNEVYKDWGADNMLAKFRMQQEMNYSPATPPTRIRLPGMMDRISDMMDTEGNQDWYICSSKKFMLTACARTKDTVRLEDFTRKFQLGYRWIQTPDGPRFEPCPNPTMASALRANHNGTAQQFKDAASADDKAKERLRRYKETMANFSCQVEQVPLAEPDVPSRPAGPTGRGLYAGSPPMPVRVNR